MTNRQPTSEKFIINRLKKWRLSFNEEGVDLPELALLANKETNKLTYWDLLRFGYEIPEDATFTEILSCLEFEKMAKGESTMTEMRVLSAMKNATLSENNQAIEELWNNKKELDITEFSKML